MKKADVERAIASIRARCPEDFAILVAADKALSDFRITNAVRILENVGRGYGQTVGLITSHWAVEAVKELRGWKDDVFWHLEETR